MHAPEKHEFCFKPILKLYFILFYTLYLVAKFPRCFNNVSRKFQGYLRKIERSSESHLGMIQGSVLKAVSKIF